MTQAFETLPYQEQLRRLNPLVESVLPRYGLREVQVVLLQYEDNTVYHIMIPTGAQYVLRVSAATGYDRAEQCSEMQWLLALRRETNVLVPEPVPALDGALITIVEVSGVAEPRHYALFGWLPGMPPAPGIPVKVMERIGACIASLHLHAEQFVPSAGFARPCWDWQRLFGPSSIMGPEKSAALLTPGQRELLAAVSVRVRDELQALETTPAHWGLIHADLHRDNILIEDGQVGVIDFDDCGWGHYLFDVASVLDSFRRRVLADPRDYPAWREAYLTGYDRVRRLPDQLDAQLATFLVMRDMTTVNFILGSSNASVQEWGDERIAQITRHMKDYPG